MSALGIAIAVFALIVVGAFLGSAVGRRLPEHHLGSESRDMVKVGVDFLATISACLGVYAPRNGTIVIVTLLCALSVAGAIFLIFEMDDPFGGFMRISDAPVRKALGYIDR